MEVDDEGQTIYPVRSRDCGTQGLAKPVAETKAYYGIPRKDCIQVRIAFQAYAEPYSPSVPHSAIDHHRTDPLFATASNMVQLWDETKYVWYASHSLLSTLMFLQNFTDHEPHLPHIH